jgi:uncharacterized membrane protein
MRVGQREDVSMRSSIKKTVVATVAALGMAMAFATAPTPAEAQFHGGGFHGGGFHGGWGGGWHGGGWNGGGWGGGWRGGWGGPGWGWRRAYWGPGWGWGGGWGWGWDPGWAIAAATVPVGVAIAANSAQPAYAGGPGCWVRRRVWTRSGHYLGRRLVNICY